MRDKIIKWNEEKIRETLNKIILQHGQFPTTSWLQKNGYGSMVGAIYSRFENIQKIAQDLGLNAHGHRKGYWFEWNNVRNEVQKLMIVTKTFPNYTQIRMLNSKLMKGLKIFEGISEVAKKMGYAPPTQIVAVDGHNVRSSYEFFMDNYLYKHGIKHNVDGYIDKKSSNFRYDFKVSGFFIEVWGYPHTESLISQRYFAVKANKEVFYKSRGFTAITFTPDDFSGTPDQVEKTISVRLKNFGILPITKKANFKIENYYHYPGYWTRERTIREIRSVIKNYGAFPTRHTLRKVGKSSLEFAMDKYGGANYFRELLGYEVKKHNHHYWTEEKVIERLKDFVAKSGIFPSHKDLIRSGHSKLAAQVEHKGGFKKFQKLFGYSPKHKPDGYYQNKGNILAECRKISLMLKHFPTAAELLTLRQNTLRRAISRAGGYKYFRELLANN